MRFIVYPEGIKRLKESGLKKVLDKGLSDYSIRPNLGSITTEDVYEASRELNKEGFYSKLPQEDVKAFLQVMDDFYYKPKKPTWEIKGSEKTYTYDGGVFGIRNHMSNITGVPASQVLSSDALAKYKEMGFDSFPELLGTVGAYLDFAKGLWSNPGGTWQTIHNRRTFESNITGSDHLDLRLFRKETTPFSTRDPLKNQVHYRPITNIDNQDVCAYSNAELQTFSIILKWVYDTKIPSDLLERQGKGFFSLAGSLDTSSLHQRQDIDELFALNESFQKSLPLFGEEQSYQYIPKINVAYRGPEDTLLFVREHTPKEIAAKYYPEEVDQMLAGMCTQASKHVGRTSLGELVNIVKYRFSEEFEKNNAEFLS